MENELSGVLRIKKFWEEILKMTDESDVMEYCKKMGIDITHQELVSLKKFINSIADKLENVDESSLKEVSGGNFWSLTSSSATANSTPLNAKSSLWSPWFGTALGVTDKAVNAFFENKLDCIDSEIKLNKERIESAESVSKIYEKIAVACVAGTLCYYGKDAVLWWMKRLKK